MKNSRSVLRDLELQLHDQEASEEKKEEIREGIEKLNELKKHHRHLKEDHEAMMSELQEVWRVAALRRNEREEMD